MNIHQRFQHIAASAVRLKVATGDLHRKLEENSTDKKLNKKALEKLILCVLGDTTFAITPLAEGKLVNIEYGETAMSLPENPTMLSLIASSLYDLIGSDTLHIRIRLTTDVDTDNVRALCDEVSKMGLGNITIKVPNGHAHTIINFTKPPLQ